MSEKVKYKEHNIYIVFKTCIDTVLALLGLILLSPLFQIGRASCRERV